MTSSKKQTVEDFERIERAPENSDRRFELIDGVIVERFPTEEQGLVVGVIAGEIMIYARKNDLGRALVKVHYHVPEDDYNVRMIDISFIPDKTRPLLAKGYAPKLPDLAIDVQSRDDVKDLYKSAEFYLLNGSRLVWLAFPENQSVTVCTLSASGDVQTRILDISDTLDGGDVLPGFTLPIKDVFDV